MAGCNAKIIITRLSRRIPIVQWQMRYLLILASPVCRKQQALTEVQIESGCQERRWFGGSWVFTQYSLKRSPLFGTCGLRDRPASDHGPGTRDQGDPCGLHFE